MSRAGKMQGGKSVAGVLVLVVLAGLSALASFSPPPSATRKAAFSREASQETLQNPQFSSGLANRFLYALGPNDLLAAGGGGGHVFR